MGKKILAFLLALVLVVSVMAGCTKAEVKPGGDKAEEKKSAETGSKEPITLDWLIFGRAAQQENFEKQKNYPTYKELVAKTGVELNAIGLEDDQVQIRIAGNDLGDLICIKTQEQLNALIESDLIYSLNELVDQVAPQLKTDIPERWLQAQLLYPNDEGLAYALPVRCGSMGFYQTCGTYLYNVRWDLYKALGYPEIKNTDDLLNVLADMVKLQPKTEDGKNVYGVSFYTSSSYWGFVANQEQTTGYGSLNGDFVFKNFDTLEAEYGVLDPESPYWKAMEFYYKANQLGILDPDCFTQQSADFNDKIKAGQLLTTMYYNSTYEKKLLETNPDSIVCYGAIPVEGSWLWMDSYEPWGWTVTYSLAIPKTCKDPARALEFISYCSSEEGTRLLLNGVEGLNWEYKDGVPVFTEQTLKAMQSGVDDAMILGFNQQPLSDLCGLADGNILSDGYEANLTMGDDYYSRLEMTPGWKDYCSYYGGSYPNEHMKNLVKEGKLKSLASANLAGNVTPTEDISRIDAACMQIALEAIPKAVCAANDAEYEKIKAETIAAAKAAGAEEAKEFYNTEWAKARAVWEQ